MISMNKEWTEEDEISSQSAFNELKRKRIKKIFEKAEKKYFELEANYNCTGSSSTYRTMQYYNDIMEICRLALQTVDKNCSRCESHRRTARRFVNKYREAKSNNFTDMLNFDSIIDDFLQCQWG